MRIAYRLQTGLMDEHGAVGEALHRFGAMRYKNDRTAFFSALLEVGETFFGEDEITYGQDFIQKQDGRLDLHRNGKGQANGHSAGVMLDLQLHKLLQLGEAHYLLVALRDLLPRHAHDRGIQENILTASEFGVEPNAKFQHRRDATVDCYLAAFVWQIDSSQDFQQGRFPGTIPADDPKKLTLIDFEIDIIQRLSGLDLIALVKFKQTLAQRATAFAGEAEGF